MRVIGFLDCYSGVSGDMLLGALVDAGLPVEELRKGLGPLALDEAFSLTATEVMKGGVRATKVEVSPAHEQPHRPFGEIARLIEGATLPPRVRSRSLTILRRVAVAEARIHGSTPDEVELHEVGSIDSIVDVVGTVMGLDLLGIEQLYASPLPVAPGDLSGRSHRIPLPGPATMALLAEAHAPTRPFGAGFELVTPTGAALVTSLATFSQPAMTLDRVAYGAGGRDLPWPNVLRLWIGEPLDPAMTATSDHVVLETNLDDMSPQLLAPVTEQLMAAGALDVTVTSAAMKKGRSGLIVSVIALASDEQRLAEMLLRETTTLGVRTYAVHRHEASRGFREVETPYGTVTVKLKMLGLSLVSAAPEFESVRARAKESGVPLMRVHAAAAAAAEALLADGGEESNAADR